MSLAVDKLPFLKDKKQKRAAACVRSLAHDLHIPDLSHPINSKAAEAQVRGRWPAWNRRDWLDSTSADTGQDPYRACSNDPGANRRAARG